MGLHWHRFGASLTTIQGILCSRLAGCRIGGSWTILEHLIRLQRTGVQLLGFQYNYWNVIHDTTSPEITSPPIKEDIADPSIVPTILSLRNNPHLMDYPLGTPDLEQVMTVALGLACDGAIPCL
ncbi:hypothetical protein DSO57_1003423 [Entomophthora muscae]|uniref:Uncharacterized protein n=1 Tax=Entomophthora muscae TaxID=34485 RepID=A0ACC2UIE3_9FUNG|nr:hypothetical protein DSO57_1003423 [Entomophthora muscae]